MSKAPVRGLYLHIPYCLAKCRYCDFASQPLAGGHATLNAYRDVLGAEIRERVSGLIDTIYIGGGTPSLCPPEMIQFLLAQIRSVARVVPGAEMTLEANPGVVLSPYLEGYRRLGINRLSLGVQSTVDRWLQWLGRRHTVAQARSAVDAARQAGFKNISCDLMYGLPEQNLADFQADLETLLAWGPEHVSIYALTVEPGTPLEKDIRLGKARFPDDDLAADQYCWACEFLKENGYAQYELSNFARVGFGCQHNQHTWLGREYIGVGASAASYVDGYRSWNEPDPDRYLTAWQEKKTAIIGIEQLKKKERIAEDMIIGLRMIDGLEKKRFTLQFGFDWDRPFRPALEEYKKAGLLFEDLDHLRLTERGRLLANQVFRALL